MESLSHVAPALPEDLPQLNRISFAAKGHWGYPAEWMERWRSDLTLEESDFRRLRIYKGMEGEEIIGWCAILDEGSYYEVDHLWVAPGFIGKGWGGRLLKSALQAAAPESKDIRVLADPHAEGFYAHQGFHTESQEESYPPGRFLPVMWKRQP